tara:strand:+ start:415 stop:1851 length:1437 start_codon:yes stop_codon:yes gene_type:complete
MALQSSGAISLEDIQSEFGGSNPIGINEYFRGGEFVGNNNSSVPTGFPISLEDFYGAVADASLPLGLYGPYFTISGQTSGHSWNRFTVGNLTNSPGSPQSNLPLADLAHHKIRLVWHVEVSGYRGDFAIDDVIVCGWNTMFDAKNLNWTTSNTSSKNWLRGWKVNDKTYAEAFSANTQYIAGPGVSALHWGISQGSGTPSSSTGPNGGFDTSENGFHMFYFEASGSGYPVDRWVRSREFQIDDDPEINFVYSNYGANLTSAKFYIDVSGGITDNPSTGLQTQNVLARGYGSGDTSNSSGSLYGNGGAFWRTISVDISEYRGMTIRVVWEIRTADFEGDAQIDTINIDGTTYSTSFTSGSGTSAWQTTQNTNSNNDTDYGSETFYDVGTNGSVRAWNERNGSTPSSSTGLSVDGSGSSSGKYLYNEASSTAQPLKQYLRSPERTIDTSATHSLSWRQATYGRAIMSLKCYIDIVNRNGY